jgi:hypothetical protein
MKAGFGIKLGVGAILAGVAAFGIAAPGSAQAKPSVVIMPSQHISATHDSAENVTRGLAQQFESQGYSVVGADKAQSTFQSQGLDMSRHYADSVALKYGRAAGADLVVYPRLLAVGLPGAGRENTILQPNAVILVRVLNTKTGGPIYCRQVGHEFSNAEAGTETATKETFNLPQPVANATAQDVLSVYFQTVANSRLERRR